MGDSQLEALLQFRVGPKLKANREASHTIANEMMVKRKRESRWHYTRLLKRLMP